MEQKLSQLFDFQRFQPNSRLEGIIADVESHYAREIDDDELLMVNAAGTVGVPTVQVEPLTAQHDIPGGEEKKAW